MIGNTYPFEKEIYKEEEDTLLFVFISVGRRKVRKVIGFTPLDQNLGIYNWGFGDEDLDPVTKEIFIDDSVITNNGDTNKVFYTVVSTLRIFLRIHPEATVRIMGRTKRLTRFYSNVIARKWNEIEAMYEINGLFGHVKEPFSVDREYDCLMVVLKSKK